jgi:hypothetical protein
MKPLGFGRHWNLLCEEKTTPSFIAHAAVEGSLNNQPSKYLDLSTVTDNSFHLNWSKDVVSAPVNTLVLTYFPPNNIDSVQRAKHGISTTVYVTTIRLSWLHRTVRSWSTECRSIYDRGSWRELMNLVTPPPPVRRTCSCTNIYCAEAATFNGPIIFHFANTVRCNSQGKTSLRDGQCSRVACSRNTGPTLTPLSDKEINYFFIYLHLVVRLRIYGAVLPLPTTSSWRGGVWSSGYGFIAISKY